MFGYRTNEPKVRLVTERMVVRLAYERDGYRLADYYSENREFLKPWEPTRDSSHFNPSSWNSRLHLMTELHRRKRLSFFTLRQSRK